MLDLRHLTVYTGAGRLDPETRCAMEWLSVLRMMHHEAHTCSGNAGHPGRSLNPASVISLYVYPTRTIIVVGGAIRVALGGTLTATGYVTLLVAYAVASGWPTPSMQEKLSTWCDACLYFAICYPLMLRYLCTLPPYLHLCDAYACDGRK